MTYLILAVVCLWIGAAIGYAASQMALTASDADQRCEFTGDQS